MPYQTAKAEDKGREKINRLSTLASEAYSANQYQQALFWWLKIIEQKPSSLSQQELALIQSNIASTFFQIGKYGAAIRHWNSSINIYRETEDTQFRYLLAATLIDIARAYLALGQTLFATSRLTEAFELIQGENKVDTLLTTAYLTLGNIKILQGEYLEAEKNYHSSLQYASNPREKTVAQTNLSKLFWTRAQNYSLLPKKSLLNRDLALEAAKKAVKESENIPSLVTVEALLQLVKVSKGKQNFNQDYYLQKAETNLSALPHSVRKVYTLINLSKFKENPVPTLIKAREIAQQINDPRSSSFVLGHLGKYYSQKRQYEKAMEWTNQARLAASTVQADDSLYQWDWQQARIYNVLGQTNKAIEAYENSLSSLQRIRNDIAIAQKKQIDFELEIEPVYRELIQLLLSNNPSQKKIKRALEIRDLLQLSELENYFGDHCLEINKELQFSSENTQKKTGLIHTIILP